MKNALKSIFVPQNLKLPEVPLLALAFLGDAVHTLAVRSAMLSSGFVKVNNLHKFSSQFCSAAGQAQCLESLVPILTEEEKDIVRRARNTKTHAPPKNCTLEVYKSATSLEVLLGFLLAREQFDRIAELLAPTLNKIKEKIC